MATKKKLTLKVIFDTNVIYTGSANDLLRNNIIDLLKNHSSLSDIEIIWYIPEIVLKERIFQMNKKGSDLLPSIQKLEKLLGHNLNINEEIIKNRINETVNNQIEDNSIQTIILDTTKVNWDSIIHNSLNRLPPFEDNDKEKGFRDALILECLIQIINDSHKTKSSCRIAFITNDGLLKDAAIQATSGNNNVDIYSTSDELVSLINILNSEITEELIKSIEADALKIFFEKGNVNTFYYTEGIRNKIIESYSNELNQIQEGVESRENDKWWISKPGFEKKIKQRVFWKTVISVDFVNYKIIYDNLDSLFYDIPNRIDYGSGVVLNPSSNDSTGKGPDLGTETNKILRFAGLNNNTITSKKDKISEGKTRFEIIWSVTLTTTKKLIKPKVESIKYLDTISV